MNRQNVIIIIRPGQDPECWGNLKKFCKEAGWKYNTMNRKSLPFEKEGIKVYRVPFK